MVYAYSQFSFSFVSDFATLWTAACQASLAITNPQSYSNSFPSNRWCHPTISSSVAPSPPTYHLSQYQGLCSESVLFIRWPEYWSFSFSISPCSEYSELISFRMDWLDLPAVQGTLKSLLQHYSSKASILQCSAFFIVPLSHSYITTGKTIALTRQAFVGKVMFLLFNMLPYVNQIKRWWV